MLTFSNELKQSYKIPLLIFVTVTAFHFTNVFSQSFDLSIFTQIAIVFAPLAASVSCFFISNNYGNSKVFGKSYFLLGVGFFSTFVDEIIFFYYVDFLLYPEYSILGDIFIFAGYPFMMAHIVINVRYFVEKLENSQKSLLIGLPVAIILGYSLVVTNMSLEDPGEFYYYLSFVSVSSIVLGLATVAFTLFRQTALISAWFVLLIGLALGTIGDILYNYAATLGIYSVYDFSNVFWISSSSIIIYALYKHQKSI